MIKKNKIKEEEEMTKDRKPEEKRVFFFKKIRHFLKCILNTKLHQNVTNGNKMLRVFLFFHFILKFDLIHKLQHHINIALMIV